MVIVVPTKRFVIHITSLFVIPRCLYILHYPINRIFIDGKCRSGALSPSGLREEKCRDCDCGMMSQFDLIREWAHERGLYDKGDPKTQTLKLMEEAGEICRAVLKNDKAEIIDGIGDCVVVLTNLAELNNVSIEDCIDAAYDEISNRTGKMVNGTFKKD